MVDVVTIGESMVLFQPSQDTPLPYVPSFTHTVAGAESNVAIGLVRLGKKARWISRLGKDPFGDMVMKRLAGEGVDLSFVIRDGMAPTAIYFKEFIGYDEPNVYYYRRGSAASRLSTDDVSDDWFAGARLLHVTGITPALSPEARSMIRLAMERAKQLGLIVSFDSNLRRKLWDEKTARETLLSLVPLCDIFLPGIEEAEFLLPSRSIDELGHTFLDMGPRVVAVKLGAEGSIGFTPDNVVRVQATPVSKIIDTVGAGDAFAAGFLSTWLDGIKQSPQDEKDNLTRALQCGNVMGAFALQFRGDWEGLPTEQQVYAKLHGIQAFTR